MTDLEVQIQNYFGLHNVVCKDLNTPTNDIIEVTTSTQRFALKLYNPQTQTTPEVQWEMG